MIDAAGRRYLLHGMVRLGRCLGLPALSLLACEPQVELRTCAAPEDAQFDTIEVETDAELEALRGCRIIEAELRIGGSVSSLAPLEHLEQVDSLTIHATEALVDLRGLESLRLTSSVELTENAALQTLDGLDAPIGVTELSVRSNPQLRSIAGLAHVRLSAFDSVTHPQVAIAGNPMLADLEGLAALLDDAPAPSVHLHSEQALDLAPLAVRSEVFQLSLTGRGLYNFEALAQLRSADSITLSDTGLPDLQPLRNVESLASLEIGQSETFVSLEGLDPALELRRLSLWELPNLSALTSDVLPVSFDLRLSQLPQLADASNLRVRPEALDEPAHLRILDCPALIAAPRLEGSDWLENLEIRRTGLTSLDDLANVADVRASTYIWDNPQLDQTAAEAWAAAHTTLIIRIGENLGWVEPDECPWLEDGQCDEPTYCAEDPLDCSPPPQGS
jgi:uncharacterized protein related to proFAR isomerase